MLVQFRFLDREDEARNGVCGRRLRLFRRFARIRSGGLTIDRGRGRARLLTCFLGGSGLRQMLEQGENEGALEAVALAIDRPLEAVVVQEHVGRGKRDREVLGRFPPQANERLLIELLQCPGQLPGQPGKLVQLLRVSKLAVFLRDTALEILDVAAPLDGIADDEFEQPGDDGTPCVERIGGGIANGWNENKAGRLLQRTLRDVGEPEELAVVASELAFAGMVRFPRGQGLGNLFGARDEGQFGIIAT
jgi:hypothetical protein